MGRRNTRQSRPRTSQSINLRATTKKRPWFRSPLSLRHLHLLHSAFSALRRITQRKMTRASFAAGSPAGLEDMPEDTAIRRFRPSQSLHHRPPRDREAQPVCSFVCSLLIAARIHDRILSPAAHCARSRSREAGARSKGLRVQSRIHIPSALLIHYVSRHAGDNAASLRGISPCQANYDRSQVWTLNPLHESTHDGNI